MRARKSNSLLLAYYGDDFTGSTDVMESLARAGLRTVLFLEPPTPKALAKFPGLRAFGIAGGSRILSPAQMEQELPLAFKALKASGAPFIHYKTCSTFDSSPTVGSIGKAIELARGVFGKSTTPLVVGAPVLGRYVVFGNLFARSGLDSEPTRLDRHPTMSRHPVTPMDEADLRLHLAAQTKFPIELIDLLKLNAFTGKIPDMLDGVKKRDPILLFDTLYPSHLPVIGKLISALRPPKGQLFCAGSSGVEYALVAHWRQEKELPPSLSGKSHSPAAHRQIIVVSGSCSPVTDRQISRALQNGFVEIACDTRMLADRNCSGVGVEDAISRAQLAMTAGRSVIFQTARGPADARRAGFLRAAHTYMEKTDAEKFSRASTCLGRGLAHILEKALQQTGARRAVVCGGDTSTHLARALGIDALEFAAPFAPGAPLCHVHAPGRPTNGCEMIFKGGQVGRDSFFADLLKGKT